MLSNVCLHKDEADPNWNSQIPTPCMKVGVSSEFLFRCLSPHQADCLTLPHSPSNDVSVSLALPGGEKADTQDLFTVGCDFDPLPSCAFLREPEPHLRGRIFRSRKYIFLLNKMRFLIFKRAHSLWVCHDYVEMVGKLRGCTTCEQVTFSTGYRPSV